MNYLLKSLLLFTGMVAYVALTFAAEPSAGNTQTQEARVTNLGGVTVKVTPVNLATSTKTWEFAIVLDTHSADLNDDLVKSSVLLDGAGGKYSPIAWEGAPPGGHHREGTLRFSTPVPRPQAIELLITRPGETAPRSFRWQIK